MVLKNPFLCLKYTSHWLFGTLQHKRCTTMQPFFVCLCSCLNRDISCSCDGCCITGIASCFPPFTKYMSVAFTSQFCLQMLIDISSWPFSRVLCNCFFLLLDICIFVYILTSVASNLFHQSSQTCFLIVITCLAFNKKVFYDLIF